MSLCFGARLDFAEIGHFAATQFAEESGRTEMPPGPVGAGVRDAGRAVQGKQCTGGHVPAALVELQTPRKYAITHLYKDMYKSKDDGAQWGYSWEMDQVMAAVHNFTTYDTDVQRVHHPSPRSCYSATLANFVLSSGGDAHRAPACTTEHPPFPCSSAGYGPGKRAASLFFRSADV